MSADKSKAAMLADSAHLGYRVQWQREAAAELRRLSASEDALIEALSFYADQDRYNGPNQRLTEPDQWSEQAGEKAYRLDVTKDRGRIAAAAIARAKEARNG